VEFVNLYTDVFSKLGIASCELRINSRKILAALAEVCGGADKLTDITIAIDKLDKIGLEKVKEELSERGLTKEQILIIEKYLGIEGSNESKLTSIKEIILDTEDGKKGISELEFILNMINDQRAKDENAKAGTITSLIIDFTLARGLNYYTGIIFEAKAPASVKIGSIGGGGRYDDLTGLFGVPNIPGVGISFGVDRIYDVMEELQLFPSKVEQGTRVLFFNTGLEESKKAYELLAGLRKSGVAAELFHEQAKFDKQFKYAEKKQIPFIIIIGSKELEGKAFMIKDLRSGEQRSVPFSDISSLSFN
jgi:histidyl-tRNA synthetase